MSASWRDVPTVDFAVIGFTIANGRIAEMDILADPDRLSPLDLSAIER